MIEYSPHKGSGFVAFTLVVIRGQDGRKCRLVEKELHDIQQIVRKVVLFTRARRKEVNRNTLGDSNCVLDAEVLK